MSALMSLTVYAVYGLPSIPPCAKCWFALGKVLQIYLLACGKHERREGNERRKSDVAASTYSPARTCLVFSILKPFPRLTMKPEQKAVREARGSVPLRPQQLTAHQRQCKPMNHHGKRLIQGLSPGASSYLFS